jgi:Cation transporter/ATPase, N-terminus
MVIPSYKKPDHAETKDGSIANAVANGLNQIGAAQQIKQYGYNDPPEKSTNPLLKFISYFWAHSLADRRCR